MCLCRNWSLCCKYTVWSHFHWRSHALVEMLYWVRNESFTNFKLKVTYIRFEIPSHRKQVITDMLILSSNMCKAFNTFFSFLILKACIYSAWQNRAHPKLLWACRYHSRACRSRKFATLDVWHITVSRLMRIRCFVGLNKRRNSSMPSLHAVRWGIPSQTLTFSKSIKSKLFRCMCGCEYQIATLKYSTYL